MRDLFPPTTTKVKLNTDDRINNDIERKTAHNINNYYGKTEKEIDKRIKELNYEWDTERVLELNFASIVLISSLLGLLSNKKWMALSGITSVFMIQHSLQGWCPPLPLIRRLGVRTATEIFEEKEALKKILNKS
ncbi:MULTISPECIES: DUF2892 domain-containing protein [Bacillaceae]|uniref:DUF2892 domain-containing protein n=3 Tax=Bacillaceae TaxID=186817 RepID=A0A0J1I700_NIACI|nr:MULTISPECIES: DUF2892 domain-containing protein [Bacillaceae]EOR22190.1 hypothetical protein A499_19368 [Niallia nealsonii AAU1]MDU1845994.1 DUF2892 domain-containing protein [Niallia nealsonii]PMC34606.1 DUF2892 domain-containing protein [Bacillus sp. UMB0899]SLL35251.1 Uncharacterised protein [Mycobacteroides abscessus subsp. abscessus]HEO8421624.1 DUF2892 domain-containing protein [Yersinia enterocolitica]